MAENEADIHCNVIQCRKSLGFDAKACVTSCSHIFCLECANRAFPRALVCPACDTQLNQRQGFLLCTDKKQANKVQEDSQNRRFFFEGQNSDDIVVTQLNPSEEYKSSVLAGLRPDIVLDICSRAIAFYQYQTSQELCFRSMIQKNLEMKCTTLQAQLNDLIQDAARHLKVEKEKSAMIQRDQEADKGRLHDLQAQLQEKTKQFHKLQSMYEKLKRKTAIPNLQQSIPPSLQFPPHPPHIGPTPYVGHPMPPPTNQPYQYPHPYPQNAYWTPPQNFLSDPRASPLQSIHNTAQSTRTYTTLGSTVSQPPYNSAYQNKQHPNKPRQNSPVHPTSNNNPASTRDPKQI